MTDQRKNNEKDDTSTQANATRPQHPNFPPGPYPIIYIRGFALGEEAIQATTETPFMGFNLGSTKHRQAFDGQIRRLIFPSPLIRLMQDHGYRPIDIDPHVLYSTGLDADRYDNGDNKRYNNHPNTHSTHPSPQHSPNYTPQSIIIHRYYDRADPHFHRAYPADEPRETQGLRHPSENTEPTPPTILQAAHDLKTLIDHLHQHTQMPQGQPFAVHLVAHSMGGLIARCLLQHPELKTTKAASLINKVFTYATPHGGISLRGLELPRFIQIQHAHHFNRRNLAQLFDLPQKDRSDQLNGDFPPDRFFCLIGTNHRDYGAGKGMAKHLIGPMSDGLVKISRASVQHSPRAHIHRTHGGAHGIVNSEAGFNNLSRFLFGTLRLDATLEVDQLPLPPALQAAKDQGHRINAGYFFEAAVAPRANPRHRELAPVYLTERRKTNASAIFRGYDELIEHPKKPHRRHPHLFSIHLDPSRSVTGEDLVVSVELTVSATDYAINGQIEPHHRLAGQRLYHEVFRVRLFPTEPQAHSQPAPQTATWPTDPRSWTLGIVSIAESFQEADEIHLLPTGSTAKPTEFVLPIERKGFQGRVVWSLVPHT